MTPEEREALQTIIEYLRDEETDFEAQGKPANHVYTSIQKLQQFLARSKS